MMLVLDPGRAEVDWVAERLEEMNFQGFVVTSERDVFGREQTFIVSCDGAAEIVRVTFDELQRRMFNDGPAFIIWQIAMAAERIWSRWMAL
jgi:hypothetical protein